MALEYESTAKSSSRYREKLRKLYSIGNLVAVLYVCENQSVKNKVLETDRTHFESVRALVHYTLADDLKQDPLMTFYDRNNETIELGGSV